MKDDNTFFAEYWDHYTRKSIERLPSSKEIEGIQGLSELELYTLVVELRKYRQIEDTNNNE